MFLLQVRRRAPAGAHGSIIVGPQGFACSAALGMAIPRPIEALRVPTALAASPHSRLLDVPGSPHTLSPCALSFPFTRPQRDGQCLSGHDLFLKRVGAAYHAFIDEVRRRRAGMFLAFVRFPCMLAGAAASLLCWPASL